MRRCVGVCFFVFFWFLLSLIVYVFVDSPSPSLLVFSLHDMRAHNQPSVLAPPRVRSPCLCVYVHVYRTQHLACESRRTNFWTWSMPMSGVSSTTMIWRSESWPPPRSCREKQDTETNREHLSCAVSPHPTFSLPPPPPPLCAFNNHPNPNHPT
jgi:hypothetical protein